MTTSLSLGWQQTQDCQKKGAVGQGLTPSSSSVCTISRGTFSGKAGLGWSVGRVEDTVRRPCSSPLLSQPQERGQLMYLLRPLYSFLRRRGRTRRALETVLTLLPSHPLSSKKRQGDFLPYISVEGKLANPQGSRKWKIWWWSSEHLQRASGKCWTSGGNVSQAGAGGHPYLDIAACRHPGPPPLPGYGAHPSSHCSSINYITFFTEIGRALDVGHQPGGTHAQQWNGDLSQGQQGWNLPLLWHTCPALRPCWSISGTSFNFHCNLASYVTMIIISTIWQQKLLKHSEAKLVILRSHY